MISKKFLKPGMLIKFHNQEVVIVSECSGKIIISWNDGSGRCLEVEDYNNDLTFSKNFDFNIDTVYDTGDYLTPFDMNPDKRLILYDRNREGFSQKEKIKAIEINYLFSSLHMSNKPIIVVPINDIIEVYNDSVKLIFPNDVFFNLTKPMFLGDIINGEIL